MTHRITIGTLLVLAGCPQPATWELGEDLAGLDLVLVTPDVGVHPDTSVLLDENNPFRHGMGPDTKWEVESSGLRVPAFYAWATMLATQPTGEHQFYAAKSLHAVHDEGRVDPDLLYFVWRNAVDGYQVVLDEFPDSVTYDATGRVGYPLAPLAFDGIVALGGTPEGWIEVTTPEGGTAVVRVDP